MQRSHRLRAAGMALAALLVAKALVSCVDLESLGNGAPDGQAPADSSAPDDAPSTPDPCSREQLPAKPEDGGASTELPTFVLAIDVVTLDPAKVNAFDLDGVCTCDTRPGVAADGGPSCTADTVTCDLDGGADNAVGVVGTAASPLIPISDISNRLISAGRRTILVQIAGYNGQANDGKVVVGSLLAEGIRAQGCPSSTFDATRQVWSRGGCGDDAWTVSPASVVTTGAGALPLVVDSDAYVRDYQLVARFKLAALLPFNEESTFSFGTPMLTGRLVPLDETLAPRDPGRVPTEKEKRLYRLESAVLAGRVRASELLATVGTYNTKAGAPPLCATGGFENVRSLLCQSVDIARAPGADPAARCDALSAAVGFVAIPALVANVADASVTSTSCTSVDAGVFSCP